MPDTRPVKSKRCRLWVDPSPASSAATTPIVVLAGDVCLDFVPIAAQRCQQKCQTPVFALARAPGAARWLISAHADAAPSRRRPRCARHALACRPARLGREAAARLARARRDVRDPLDGRAGTDAVHDRAGDPGRHRRGRRRSARDLGAPPARARARRGLRRRDAPPLRGAELAPRVVPARPGRLPPRGAVRPRRASTRLDGRGGRDRLQRRNARWGCVRHHRARVGSNRVVRRRRGDPSLELVRPRDRRARRRPDPRRHARWGHQAAPGTAAGAAGRGRPAHGPRRRHCRRASRPARDRRGAGVLRPLPRALSARAPGRRRRCDPTVDARRRAGAAARHLRGRSLPGSARASSSPVGSTPATSSPSTATRRSS